MSEWVKKSHKNSRLSEKTKEITSIYLMTLNDPN